MIISFSRRFVLVRARKVAGTSVEMALSTLCGGRDIVTPMIPVDERTRQAMGGFSGNYCDAPLIEQGYRRLVRTASPEMLARLRQPRSLYDVHIGLPALRERLGAGIAGFAVAIVQRHPAARILSFLNMRQSMDSYRKGGRMAADPDRLPAVFDTVAEAGTLSRLATLDLYDGFDAEGRGFVIRYESLQPDFDRFLRAIGWTAPVALPHAKRGLMADPDAARSILRPDQIRTVNRLFAAEFDRFGYRPL